MNHQIGVAGVLLFLALGALGGCTTVERSFPEHQPEAVWRAAVAAAESPTYYADWHIIENNVWADAENNRLEIYRRLMRDETPYGADPHRRRRNMEFTVNLLTGEEGEPLVEFISRHIDVPSIARDEAEFFFEDMQDILAGAPMPPAGNGMQAPEPMGEPTNPPSNGGGNEDDVDNADVPIDIDDF